MDESMYTNWLGTLPQQFRPERTNSESLYDFICDAITDLSTLPDCAMGSTALVVEPPSVYMKGSAGWMIQEVVTE